MIPPMFARFVALTTAAALLTACGSSQDDQIVMRDPSNGTERTYGEVRDLVAKGSIDLDGTTCAAFAAYGSEQGVAEYPEGQSAFVEACEAGLKDEDSG